MQRAMAIQNWGNRPWTITFQAKQQALPESVDFAVVGGGFTGLAAAAWLKRLALEKSVALLEAGRFGDGASGHTGGMALAESAAGDLPGLGDVLAGYERILSQLGVDGDVELPGVYEIARGKALGNTPIRWKDSGELCAVKEVPGGSVNPGKVIDGLAQAGAQRGVLLFEEAAVWDCEFGEPLVLHTAKGTLRAGKVLFATNAFAFELTGWTERTESCFTLALATEELDAVILEEVGLGEGKPFYTADLPYLWGRLLGRQIVFGSGLVHFKDWREVYALDISRCEAAELFKRLEGRIHGLHPKLRDVKVVQRWGGPICLSPDWVPIFERHAKSKNAIVLGGFSGHGVAQSVYLGEWAAEALLGKRELPRWKRK
jgi:glycine/D-amino acid oxidase-like deaminating enzyme